MRAALALPSLRNWPGFVWYSARRFWRDECLAKAAGLAFDLLFALIPTIAIGFAILSAFPVLNEVRIGLQAYIIKSFLPQHGQEITALFDLFIQKTRALTAFSVVILALSALLLFNTVDSVFNRIWPPPVSRSQPAVFASGSREDVLQVAFNPRSSTAWVLGSAFAMANGSSTQCGARVLTIK